MSIIKFFRNFTILMVSSTIIFAKDFPKINIQDTNALQRGAKIYMNYCSGCHSIKYLRYNQLALGLNLLEPNGKINTKILFDNLVFGKARLYDPIISSMTKTNAIKWFGVIPPDLSLIVRAKGSNFLFNYLQSFYIDKTKNFGTNNLAMPNTNMPNVLEVISGTKILVPATNTLIQNTAGTMSEQEFLSTIQDLVTFLTFVSEPHKVQQQKIGIFVLIFLSLLFIILLRMYLMLRKS